MKKLQYFNNIVFCKRNVKNKLFQSFNIPGVQWKSGVNQALRVWTLVARKSFRGQGLPRAEIGHDAHPLCISGAPNFYLGCAKLSWPNLLAHGIYLHVVSNNKSRFSKLHSLPIVHIKHSRIHRELWPFATFFSQRNKTLQTEAFRNMHMVYIIE